MAEQTKPVDGVAWPLEADLVSIEHGEDTASSFVADTGGVPAVEMAPAADDIESDADAYPLPQSWRMRLDQLDAEHRFGPDAFDVGYGSMSGGGYVGEVSTAGPLGRFDAGRGSATALVDGPVVGLALPGDARMTLPGEADVALPGEARVAEVQSLIDQLPLAWDLASPSTSSVAASAPGPAPRFGAQAAAHGVVLGGVVAAEAALAAPVSFETEQHLDDAFLGQIAADIAQERATEEISLAPLGVAAEEEADAPDPALRNEQLMIGDEDGGAADRLGAIATGAPTGAIGLAQLADEPEPEPAANVFMRTDASSFAAVAETVETPVAVVDTSGGLTAEEDERTASTATSPTAEGGTPTLSDFAALEPEPVAEVATPVIAPEPEPTPVEVEPPVDLVVTTPDVATPVAEVEAPVVDEPVAEVEPPVADEPVGEVETPVIDEPMAEVEAPVDGASESEDVVPVEGETPEDTAIAADESAVSTDDDAMSADSDVAAAPAEAADADMAYPEPGPGIDPELAEAVLAHIDPVASPADLVDVALAGGDAVAPHDDLDDGEPIAVGDVDAALVPAPLDLIEVDEGGDGFDDGSPS